MTDDNQHIIDRSDLRKYRTELPNLYDDADLDVFEFRLLAHYKRVGTCNEGIEFTALKCHMSAGQVSEKRMSLSKKKWVKLTPILTSHGPGYAVEIIDRWEENFRKYSRSKGSPHEPKPSHSEGKPSHSEGKPSHSEGKPSHSEGKKELIKKEPLKNSSGAEEHRAAPAPENEGFRAKLRELDELFEKLTGLSVPAPRTGKEGRAFGETWYQPMRRMLALANSSAPSLMRETVGKMKFEKLTISSPKSIEKTFGALRGERKLNGSTRAAEWVDPMQPIYDLMAEKETLRKAQEKSDAR